MSKIGIFMAQGCEEIEGLTVVDVARRAGIEVIMISLNHEVAIKGSHKIIFLADERKKDVLNWMELFFRVECREL